MQLEQLKEAKPGKRPIGFYKAAWSKFQSLQRKDDGQTQSSKAVEAFAHAKEKYPDVTLSGCMTNPSQALSHMKDDVKRKLGL